MLFGEARLMVSASSFVLIFLTFYLAFGSGALTPSFYSTTSGSVSVSAQHNSKRIFSPLIFMSTVIQRDVMSISILSRAARVENLGGGGCEMIYALSRIIFPRSRGQTTLNP